MPAISPDTVVSPLPNARKKHQSVWQLAVRRFMKNKLAVVGLITLFLIVLISVAAPFIATYDPNKPDIYNIDGEPDDQHLLGTDDVGRDVFARLLYGGRISLLVGLVSSIMIVLIGGFLGAIAGYYGKWIDSLIMRMVDILLVLPTLLLMLFVVTIMQKTTIWSLIAVFGLTSWPVTARLVRGEVLSIREREYVLSAKAIGCSDLRIIMKHVLPNVLPTIIVNATLLMATMILAESGLSYLGFGVAPEITPTWGNMLHAASNVTVLTDQPWLWIPPGLMVVLTVLSINFIGDGLRDAFDIKSTRR
ncbi:oligopeptide ABC transporter permease [Thermoflavimicrobium dichotomicum]|uniref:Peptide/nickel transport system permease protein n=1 Tax=Thermoflavimicrobium dichotomicum TaxID=46223 RepID=A0A1I3LQ13_9BACL|nr:oligopeptide ABC transporter permease [Thermoflavimicrobium dichotomicum]SFI86807.1 peptide/nickel transport system permease protein [Thermoflavimicrobium dichotomicum]